MVSLTSGIKPLNGMVLIANVQIELEANKIKDIELETNIKNKPKPDCKEYNHGTYSIF